MVDVARLSGVALSTVSRVVNGDPGARAATVLRVKNAIRELGWEGDELARQLRRGESGTLGAAARDIGGSFCRAVERSARHAGLMLLSASTGDIETDEGQVIRALCRRRVDGLVVEPVGNDHAFLGQEIANGLPVVAIDRPLSGIKTDCVLSDNAGGIRLAYKHLQASGHRRIGYIGDTETIYTGKVRAATFRRCAAQNGGADQLTATPGTQRAAFRASLDRLLDQESPPTALITGNAASTIEALLWLGPDARGLALVSFDDLEFAALVRPAITVLAQDFEAMGSAAVSLLAARRANAALPVKKVTVPVTLIARGSGERPPS
ncbi:MAG: LacI family transcriptional regulator [Frankiales bacterium]|jgi:LacI family transcriptional regulator|nr:LacI family transcriptional regulator [Frankiales bacterium]